jgi:16S rRNA (guanine527-N7)-methyltransferase
VKDLRALLVEACSQGLVGDQGIEMQLEHARGFADVCTALLEADPRTAAPLEGGTGTEPPTRVLDLGSGGGLPGLVLATTGWPRPTQTFLLDGSARRAEWLLYAVTELGLDGIVGVIGERAEIVGRSPSWRHRQSIVVARSFGRPAVTAECAAPLLSIGGFLVVSEPPPVNRLREDQHGTRARAIGADSPEITERWPPGKVAELGFAAATEWRARGCRYAVLRTEAPCPERYPRRNGIPAKRPLW